MKVLCSAQMGMNNVMGQTMRVVAIAKALQGRGHDVLFIAAGKLIPIIKSFGIDVLEAGNMPDTVLLSDSQDNIHTSKAERMARMQETMAKIMQLEVDIATKEKPQLFLTGTISGPSAARQVGIPSMFTLLQLMTCIACGTPAVVVPSIGEQEDNGNVLAQFGAGIVLDKETLTPAIMAEAIQKIIGDSSYRMNAQKLKAIGEKYGGANAAADWAEQLVGTNIK